MTETYRQTELANATEQLAQARAAYEAIKAWGKAKRDAAEAVEFWGNKVAFLGNAK